MESVEFVLSTKFMQSDPKTSLGFVRALVKAMRFLEARPEEADPFLAKVLKVTPETVKVARQHILLTQPHFDYKGARVMLDELLADGRVKGVSDRDGFLKKLVDESLLTRATAELDREGWKP
jgi:ABC-type nitrate/sulfonate/bicarbonate transport system substrate-binding protein